MEHRVLTLASIIDAYVANYQGRDPSLLTCLDFWRSQLGELELTAIDADTIEDAMAELAERGAMRYVCGKGLCPRDGRNAGTLTANRLAWLGHLCTVAAPNAALPEA